MSQVGFRFNDLCLGETLAPLLAQRLTIPTVREIHIYARKSAGKIKIKASQSELKTSEFASQGFYHLVLVGFGSAPSTWKKRFEKHQRFPETCPLPMCPTAAGPSQSALCLPERRGDASELH